MPITAAGLGIAGAALEAASFGANVLGANKASKEARKSRRAAERLGAETLAFAREVFNNFQPVIKDTTDFFANTSLEDIVSGAVLAPGARGAINRFNTATQDATRRVKTNLAQRGIANDPAGVSTLSEFELSKARGVTDIAQGGVESEIDRRLGLTQLGTQTAGLQINAANRITDQLFAQAGRARGEAGAQAVSAGKSLAEIASLIDNRTKKRKDPTTLV